MQKFLDSVLTFIFRLLADRKLLECKILPELIAQAQDDTIIFVGTHWYTERYNRMYADTSIITIDFDPIQAKFGSASHIVDSLENIGNHCAQNSISSIVCNGVFGWGLNEKHCADQAFSSCFDILQPGGWLVIGWNDIPSRKPFDLSEIVSLQKFSRTPFPRINSAEVTLFTYNRHRFSFYQKPIENKQADNPKDYQPALTN